MKSRTNIQYSRFPGVAVVAFVAILGAPQAHAADPTTADCLAATEASLKSGNEHHLRTERNQLLICAAATCPDDIRKECLRRVEDVNAAIPTIIFEAKDAAGNDLSAVRVTMDGEDLAERLEGTALSIDPGQHTFVFETPGQRAVAKRFVIRESEKDRREAFAFGVAMAAPLFSQPMDAGAVRLTPAAAERNDGLGTQTIVGIVFTGLGAVGLGVGSAFGLAALSKKNEAQEVCPGQCATQTGVNDWSDAKSNGNVSTALFIGGGIALATGVVLWVTAPSSNAMASARVGVGPGGIRAEGTW